MIPRRKIRSATARHLRQLVGLDDLDACVGVLLRRLQLAEAEADKFARTCSDMQARVETAQEDLDRRDAALVEHVNRLGEACGLEGPVTEVDVMERVAVNRETAGLIETFLHVLAGTFDPGEELLRRVSAAMGLCNGNVEDVLRHLGRLPDLRRKVNELQRQVAERDARIQELEP